MSYFNNQQEAPAVSYPPTEIAYSSPSNKANPQTSYVSAPPPMGYPTKDGPQQSVPEETTTRGDGFWKACCAAICCCCVLDWCF